MKRFVFLFFLLPFLLAPIPAAGNASAVLENMLNPFSIDVVGEHIIVLDLGDSLVKVFDRKTLNKTATIGKIGEGPGEYRPEEIMVLPTAENICVSAVKKVLFFSYDGQLLSEKSFTARFNSILPVKDRYLGISVSLGGESFTLDYHLIDASFKSIKLLHNGPWAIDKKSRKWSVFEVFFYGIMQDKLIVAHRTEPKVMIFDADGALEEEIVLEKKTRPFSTKDKERIERFMMSTTRNRDRYTSLKDRLVYPDTFPFIMTCRIDGPSVYVLTYTDILGRGIETLKYTLAAKTSETVYVPLTYSAPNYPMISPFCIHEGILYQVQENDTGDWELRRSIID